jgi:hypothetical protein
VNKRLHHQAYIKEQIKNEKINTKNTYGKLKNPEKRNNLMGS